MWLKENLLIISTGAAIGVLALLLTAGGNPKNMGFCIACFERDIAGAVGLHRADAVQYIRPEIIGIVLGAMGAALIFRELRPQGGSSPLLRFLLGAFTMTGALVFLGCPLRMIIRLGSGDMNALLALAGFCAGIFVGVLFLRAGFNFGRSSPQSLSNSLILPAMVIILLVLLLAKPAFLFFSSRGPGSQHAFWLFSLCAGALVGFLGQRSRFCAAGGIRDTFLIGDTLLLRGLVAMLLAVLLGNIFFVQGGFHAGFAMQPVAHSSHLWNFSGMVVVGIAAVMLGGCPFRQLVLAGSGNTDSALTVLGMTVGAGIAHNFMLTAKPDSADAAGNLIAGGPGIYGQIFIFAAIIVLLLVGIANREK